MLRDADVALYRAKAGGKGAYRMFDPAIDRRQQHMFAIEQDLRLALPGNQFLLEYQPIVDAVTLAPLRYEALLRWRHPVDGIVPPSDFVPLAERTGLIVPIGLWVLETACRAATEWPENVELSVNLSPAQFTRGDLPQDLVKILKRTGLAPSRLHLEVTEGLLLDDTHVVLGGMARLREAGVRFSLDDFGTAHAGLTYLRRFPFDTLKIDKSFVQDATESKEARAIVAAIMAMGAAFDLTIIAEGVEDGSAASVRAGVWVCDGSGLFDGAAERFGAGAGAGMTDLGVGAGAAGGGGQPAGRGRWRCWPGWCGIGACWARRQGAWTRWRRCSRGWDWRRYECRPTRTGWRTCRGSRRR